MAQPPPEQDVLAWFDSLSNWGRWGEDDQLGTLNLITDDVRRRAAKLVQVGRRISCSWDLDATSGSPVWRFMRATGQGALPTNITRTSDIRAQASGGVSQARRSTLPWSSMTARSPISTRFPMHSGIGKCITGGQRSS